MSTISPRYSFEWRDADTLATIAGTFAAYGITNVRIEEGENSTGTMTWDIPTANAELYAFFTAGSRIRVLLDDERFWEGYVVDPFTEIEPGQETFRLTARDPWSWFEITPARQQWRKLVGGDEMVDFGRLIFFAAWDTGLEGVVLRDCATELTELVTNLIALGAEIQLGSLSSGSTPSAEQLANVTFREAFEAISKYDQGIGYFTYTNVGDPVFNWKVPSSLSPVTVHMGNGYGMARLRVAPTRTGALKYARVMVLDPDASNGAPAPNAFYTTIYPPAYDLTAAKASMNGVEWSCDKTDEFSAVDADAVAQAIYEAGQAAGWQGSIVYQAMDGVCDRTLALGKKLNIASPSLKWTGMNAPIRHCTYNLDDGTTEVEFGPSTRLGPADLYSLVRAHASKMRAALAALKCKATGESEQYGMSGDGDRGGANGSPWPPLGYEPFNIVFYDPVLGQMVQGKIVVNRSGAPALADPPLARVIQRSGSDLVLGTGTLIKIEPD